ncbi:uncharacterized protein [Haliotis asinina]|uniref:uncharacterized protein isoform X2 n=1 Tax=Haliotis asinina TaxID=109174 RepID=UPI003531A59F
MDALWSVLLILLVTQVGMVRPQGSGPEATQNFKFFMDSTKDCNGPVYNVFDKQAVIKGQSSSPIQSSLLSCTIRLNTENNFEKTTFRVTVNAMKIDDCDVTLAIYDGEPGQPLIDSYDCNKGKGRTEMFTTGKKVSIVLTRRDERNTRYDIELIIKPLVAGQDPGYENDFGEDYGYYNRLVPNMVIYIIVAVLFFIIIVIIIIVAIVCHRKHKGLNKPAERYNISYINTGSVRGPASTNTRNWVSTSRTSLQRDQNRKHRHHSDDDSVFNEDSMPRKKRYEADQSFDTYQSRGRNNRPDRLRQDKYRNPSYEDEHPPERIIQREIIPRVKSKPQRYEPEEEEEAESIGVGPDEEEEDQVEEQETEDEEEASEEEEEDEEDEEEEEEDGDDQEDAAEPSQPQPDNLPEHPPPRLGHPSMSGIPQPMARHPHDQPHSFPGDPRHMPVNPQQMAGPYGPRFMMYPGQPGPQFMPMAPGPGHFQPIQGHPNMPPPTYPGDARPQPKKPYEVKPSDPPIYSYLVQRGYQPVDGRDSPVSVSTNASACSDTHLIQPEDSDMSAHNLASGVEFMRR